MCLLITLLVITLCFIFVSDLKIVYYTNYQSLILGRENERMFFRHYLFGPKLIYDCLKIDATH